MNNYIINGSDELIHEAIKKFGDPVVYISSTNQLKTRANHALKVSDLFSCKYDIPIKDLSPIDSALLDKLESCEVNYLKMCDRINLYGGYQKRKDDYICHVRYWNHILKKNKVEFVIFMNIPHEGYDFILYSLCKLNSIKTFMFYHLPHRPGFTFLYLLEDINQHLPQINSKVESLKLKMTNISISDISSPLNLFLKEQLNLFEEKLIPFTGEEKGFAKSLLGNLYKKIINFMMSFRRGSLQSPINKINNFVKTNLFRDAYLDSPSSVLRTYKNLSIDPDFKEKYIYFPLHYQPELSTNPLGGQYVNQLLVVEMLSKVMPNMKIYVKDHPRSGNFFKNNIFYKSLTKLRNVNLINLDADTYKLIQYSEAVATVTGTAGLEAIIRGKPVLMFGNRFYEHAPGVFKIRTLKDLNEASNVIENSFSFELKEVLYFFKAIEEFVFEGVMDPLEEEYSTISHIKSAKKMIDLIHKKISLI